MLGVTGLDYELLKGTPTCGHGPTTQNSVTLTGQPTSHHPALTQVFVSQST
jgi:hypothetical protein